MSLIDFLRTLTEFMLPTFFGIPGDLADDLWSLVAVWELSQFLLDLGWKAVATGAGDATWFSAILLLILTVYFVASLYSTSMISFSVHRCATLGPPFFPLTRWILHSYDLIVSWH